MLRKLVFHIKISQSTQSHAQAQDLRTQMLLQVVQLYTSCSLNSRIEEIKLRQGFVTTSQKAHSLSCVNNHQPYGNTYLKPTRSNPIHEAHLTVHAALEFPSNKEPRNNLILAQTGTRILRGAIAGGILSSNADSFELNTLYSTLLNAEN